MADATVKTSDDGIINASELMPCMAAGCCITSYYFEYPNCMGAKIIQETCCINSTVTCCKPSSHPDKCCVIYEGACKCLMPQTCIKAENQLCCIDIRVGLPCDDTELPCLCTIAGLTIMYKWQNQFDFCKPMGDIDPKFDEMQREFKAKYAAYRNQN